MNWWEANTELRRHTNIRVSGSPDIDWIEYTLTKYYRERLPIADCLSLGCGYGEIERRLSEKNVFVHCDGYEDAGEKAILEAIREARERRLRNIDYHIVDMNELTLPPYQYDAVWVNGAFHHIEALEHVCHQVKQALNQDGLFIINEYIGPSRFQFPRRQKELVNSCLQILPGRYRTLSQDNVDQGLSSIPSRQSIRWITRRIIDKIKDGDLIGAMQRRIRLNLSAQSRGTIEKVVVKFPTINDVIAFEPTLAIRSGEVVDVLQNEFDIIEKKDWGGNILNFLLSGIAHHFSDNDPIAMKLIKMLINIEDTFLDIGEFESDFAFIVARPKLQTID